MKKDEREFWKSFNEKKSYSEDDFIYKGKQAVASKRLKQALDNGTIEKDTICATCDIESDKLVAHHYRGYDYPFSVWWICRSCNYYLPHNNISIEDARNLILEKKFKKPLYYLKRLNKKLENCGVCDIPDKIKNMNIVNNYPYESMVFLCENCYSKMAA